MATRVEVGPDATGLDGGERLPWLEAVEDEDERTGPSAAKLIGALLVGLLAIAAIVGGLFWLGNRDGGATRVAGGEPELIRAPEGPYKVKPAEPGGMKVEGKGDQAFATSEGADPNARLNLDAIPEAPVAGARGTKAGAESRGTQRQPVERTRVAVRREPAASTPATPAPATGGGAGVQLGAFSSNASAEAAWKSLSGRFAVLKGLGHSVQGATVGGKSVHRLRASVADRAAARELCGRLTVAGESCVIL